MECSRAALAASYQRAIVRALVERLEAMGAQGLGWEGEAFSPGEIAATHGWLRSKGNSIEGGTSEVNVNVVAKRVLGLPDPK